MTTTILQPFQSWTCESWSRQ